LVARPFGSPQNLFPLVAAIANRNQNFSIDARLFEKERVLAEKRARKKTGKPEVTIGDIYAECQTFFFTLWKVLSGDRSLDWVGRLKGILLAFKDIVLGRSHPRHILDL
jgi:hypothetical protein